MKKLLLFLCIPFILFCGGCADTAEDYSSQIKMEVRHIISQEGNKTIDITFPTVGGIEESRTLATINNSILNYVEMQENEFDNALDEDTENAPIVEDFDATVTKQIEEKTTLRIYYDEEGNPVDREGNPLDEETLQEYHAAQDEKTNGDENVAEEDPNSDKTGNTGVTDKNADGTDNTDAADGNTKNTDKKTDTTKQDDSAISLTMTFKVTYQKNNILNILETYTKVLGENKTYVGQQSFVFDLEKGLPIALGDIYDFESDFPTVINDTVNKQITESNMQLYQDKSGFAGIRKDTNFYLDGSDNTIHIFYNALEISPEKDLIPTFTFSLKKLNPYLTETYAAKLN